MFDDTLVSTNPLAVLVPQKTPRDYTLAEYLRREKRATELHEYYDGNIIKLPMARGPHNEIVGNMTAALKGAKHHLKFFDFSQVNNWCICRP
jgi:Uma2 family endonuclease